MIITNCIRLQYIHRTHAVILRTCQGCSMNDIVYIFLYLYRFWQVILNDLYTVKSLCMSKSLHKFVLVSNYCDQFYIYIFDSSDIQQKMDNIRCQHPIRTRQNYRTVLQSFPAVIAWKNVLHILLQDWIHRVFPPHFPKSHNNTSILYPCPHI